MIFEITTFAVITAWLAFAVAVMLNGMGTADGPYEAAGLAFGLLAFVFVGGYIHLGTFLFSFAFLVAALYFKKEFVKKADKDAEGYEKCLKIKKRNVMHFSLLMAYSVLSVILIYIVMSV